MSISKDKRDRVIKRAGYRCEYCRVALSEVYSPMHLDHIVPLSRGGTDGVDNLALSCPRCNAYKHDHMTAFDPETGREVRLFNPRQDGWADHFEPAPADRAMIVGKTAEGRATVSLLRFNSPESLVFRQMLVRVGKYPPQ